MKCISECGRRCYIDKTNYGVALICHLQKLFNMQAEGTIV